MLGVSSSVRLFSRRSANCGLGDAPLIRAVTSPQEPAMSVRPTPCLLPFPHEVWVRVTIIIIVVTTTLALVRHGYEAGSALALITIAGGTAMELARRLLAPDPTPFRKDLRPTAGQ